MSTVVLWPSMAGLAQHGVEPTNNRAERALRFGVLWRKRSQGTASDKGNRWVERLLSLKETCRLGAKSTYAVLVEAITSLFHGQHPDLSWLTAGGASLLSPYEHTCLVEDSTMRRSIIGLMLTLALTILVAPLLANAQPRGRVPRIGVLAPTSPAARGAFVDGFGPGLRELGWVEGESIAVEWRWAEGKLERLPELAADLVRLNVDVIVALSTPASLAAKHATTTIPIVASAGDLLRLGLVASLAQPGGNITGVTLLVGEGFSGKWLELLKEVVPTLSRVAYLMNPANVLSDALYKDAQDVAPALNLTVEAVEVRSPDELDRAFAVMMEQADAFIVEAPFSPYCPRIVELAARHRLPAIYQVRSCVDAGGLMSYGPSFSAVGRRAAVYVDKILKGTKPADLPVEQPTKFELVINLKTAQALDLTLPPTLLFRADEVIR